MYPVVKITQERLKFCLPRERRVLEHLLIPTGQDPMNTFVKKGNQKARNRMNSGSCKPPSLLEAVSRRQHNDKRCESEPEVCVDHFVEDGSLPGDRAAKL